MMDRLPPQMLDSMFDRLYETAVSNGGCKNNRSNTHAAKHTEMKQTSASLCREQRQPSVHVINKHFRKQVPHTVSVIGYDLVLSSESGRNISIDHVCRRNNHDSVSPPCQRDSRDSIDRVCRRDKFNNSFDSYFNGVNANPHILESLTDLDFSVASSDTSAHIEAALDSLFEESVKENLRNMPLNTCNMMPVSQQRMSDNEIFKEKRSILMQELGHNTELKPSVRRSSVSKMSTDKTSVELELHTLCTGFMDHEHMASEYNNRSNVPQDTDTVTQTATSLESTAGEQNRRCGQNNQKPSTENYDFSMIKGSVVDNRVLSREEKINASLDRLQTYSKDIIIKSSKTNNKVASTKCREEKINSSLNRQDSMCDRHSTMNELSKLLDAYSCDVLSRTAPSKRKVSLSLEGNGRSTSEDLPDSKRGQSDCKHMAPCGNDSHFAHDIFSTPMCGIVRKNVVSNHHKQVVRSAEQSVSGNNEENCNNVGMCVSSSESLKLDRKRQRYSSGSDFTGPRVRCKKVKNSTSDINVNKTSLSKIEHLGNTSKKRISAKVTQKVEKQNPTKRRGPKSQHIIHNIHRKIAKSREFNSLTDGNHYKNIELGEMPLSKLEDIIPLDTVACENMRQAKMRRQKEKGTLHRRISNDGIWGTVNSKY